MSHLLDTSVFVFLSQAPGRVPARARELVEDGDAALFVSAASWYEINWKIALGKLPMRVGGDLDAAAASLVAQKLAVTPEQAALAARLPSEHRDPWDRIIAAQALSLGLTVISPDERFDDLGAARLWR